MTGLDLSLVGTALLLGLAGGPHCAAMCGAAQLGAARACAAPGRDGLLALHAGRLVAYALAGGLLAAGIGWLGGTREASAALASLWRLANAAVIGVGLWLVWTGEQPAWLSFARVLPGGGARLAMAGGPATITLHRTSSPGRRWRAGLVGAAWALLPCGLLQSALVTSALASGAAAGAAVMASFALASALSMALAQAAWTRLLSARPGLAALVNPRLAVRLAGALLVLAAGYALAHDIGRAMGAAWCQ